MAIDETSQPIVRYSIDALAPTGESVQYETADGTVWRDAPVQLQEETGQYFGVKCGERIYLQ